MAVNSAWQGWFAPDNRTATGPSGPDGMPQLRVALAQVNTCVGDLDGNAETVVAWTRKAAEAGAHVALFPEMALTGYPVEDLALRPSFSDAARRTLESLAERLADGRLRRTWRSSSATSTATTPARATRPPCSTGARWSPGSSSTSCPTTACSTSTGSSSRATSWPWSGCTAWTSAW